MCPSVRPGDICAKRGPTYLKCNSRFTVAIGIKDGDRTLFNMVHFGCLRFYFPFYVSVFGIGRN